MIGDLIGLPREQHRRCHELSEISIAGEPADAGGVFVPAKVWDWSPLGYPVVGVSSRYAFELRHPDVNNESEDIFTVDVLVLRVD
mgnify:CR=1 FL=1